jgi:hypothetical protein
MARLYQKRTKEKMKKNKKNNKTFVTTEFRKWIS